MKHNLSEEVRRMQKLAGIITEAKENSPLPPKSTSTAASPESQNSKTVSPNVVNLPDEKRLQMAIDKSPLMLQRLKDIGVTELDGLFSVILSKTKLEDTSKTVIIAAITRALKDLEPTKPTITTTAGKD